MPLPNYLLDTGVAGGTIAVNRFIKLDSTATAANPVVVYAAGATAFIDGIATRVEPQTVAADSTTSASAGDQLSYAGISGVQTYLVVNAASVNIVPGDILTSAANGIGVKSTTEADFVGAVAREAATTDGVTILVEVAKFKNSVA